MRITTLTREQVRAYDKHAIEQIGIPSVVLMENAGRGAAEVLRTLGIHGKVAICCGKGNNGGDGLVLARHLANWGFDTLSLLFAHPDQLAPDAGSQWKIVQKMSVASKIILARSTAIDESILAATFAQADWIVDAMFGTGLTGPLRPPFDRIVEIINEATKRVLAIDIPSGLDCDTGVALGRTIRAAHTVTFVAQKQGFTNPTSATYTGTIHVADIGIVLHERP
ncbi:MAG: NAD(P)H-hydrate epimerase [Gemmataceae bacterium]|nr:NAD(P)H-hydrate epimerase [Gemmataceae bacterium]